jgi:hypothetical protein
MRSVQHPSACNDEAAPALIFLPASLHHCSCAADASVMVAGGLHSTLSPLSCVFKLLVASQA